MNILYLSIFIISILAEEKLELDIRNSRIMKGKEWTKIVWSIIGGV